MMKAIGGYFSWEFSMDKTAFPHDKGILVNSGHGALQLILQSIGRVSKLWIPYFTCDIVPEALKAIGVTCEFYHLNFDLEIDNLPELESDEYLLYTNYFGIMDSYVLALADCYKDKLIIDNAQAFFTPESKECHQIYSPRKFVGVPDGGIVVSSMNIDISQLVQNDASNYCSHLLLRSEGKVTEGYELFKSNDNALRNFTLAKMSLITQKILHSLDYQRIIEVRKSNYNYLHSNLGTQNGFIRLLQRHNEHSFACPMVYPFYTNDVTLRARFIRNNIFVAQYWPNVLKWCSSIDCEYALCNHIVPIPVDQRYGEKEMNQIIEIITRQ